MSELIISTDDGSIINTPYVLANSHPYSRILNDDDGEVIVIPLSMGGTTVVEGDLPIYSTTDYPLYSTSGIPLHAALITEEDEDNFDGYQLVGEALITIDWSDSSRKDLDCCAYWSDNSSYKIGWSYGKGSLGDSNYRAWWTGDDTGDGPETIALFTTSSHRCPAESSPYQFKVHLNFYGDASGTATATVTVTFGDTTLSKTIAPSTNDGNQATTSDPYVTITFSSDGIPTVIA